MGAHNIFTRPTRTDDWVYCNLHARRWPIATQSSANKLTDCLANCAFGALRVVTSFMACAPRRAEYTKHKKGAIVSNEKKKKMSKESKWRS